LFYCRLKNYVPVPRRFRRLRTAWKEARKRVLAAVQRVQQGLRRQRLGPEPLFGPEPAYVRFTAETEKLELIWYDDINCVFEEENKQ
jgi:hypothetical protein